MKELFDCQELKFGADNNQNTIKNAFMGGGYYSGFVIDCDKKILAQEAWAWGDADGQWMGLPLANIASLFSTLDGYLADPPECFDPAGADADADSDADSDSDADGDSDSDTDGDADTDADGDSDSDGDGDGDADDDDNDNEGDDDDDDNDDDDDDDNNDDDNDDDNNDETDDGEGDSDPVSGGGGAGGCHQLVGSPASPLLRLLSNLF